MQSHTALLFTIQSIDYVLVQRTPDAEYFKMYISQISVAEMAGPDVEAFRDTVSQKMADPPWNYNFTVDSGLRVHITIIRSAGRNRMLTLYHTVTTFKDPEKEAL